MKKLFIDAMGGDRGPETVVQGLRLAAPGLHLAVVLLGDEAVLQPLIKSLPQKPEIVHCPSNIEMDESPVQAVRTKKESPIVRGLELTAENPGSAFFSAGHSGAVFAAALRSLGRIEGVERPAIATLLPSSGSKTIFVDAGANVECRPSHLVDFALMGMTYAELLLGKQTATVALLSNGEESSKGTELTRTADEAMRTHPVLAPHYKGYIEGKELMSGVVDVVVTDGFTGNVVLKSLEGLGSTISLLLRRELRRGLLNRLGALALAPAIRRIWKQFDYAEIGSAPLLGVDGNCFIGHGRSSARAIKNGILTAQRGAELELCAKLRARFGLIK